MEPVKGWSVVPFPRRFEKLAKIIGKGQNVKDMLVH